MNQVSCCSHLLPTASTTTLLRYQDTDVGLILYITEAWRQMPPLPLVIALVLLPWCYCLHVPGHCQCAIAAMPLVNALVPLKMIQ